jgi:hypothetical protein
MSPKKFLKKNGVSIAECAAILGCSRGWLTNALNGSGCSRRLAKAFEIYTGGKISRLQLLYPDEFFEKNPFDTNNQLSKVKAVRYPLSR